LRSIQGLSSVGLERLLDRQEVGGSNPPGPTLYHLPITLMKIKTFVFNPFQENTFILYDDSSECCIIDPGCNSVNEEKKLSEFIDSKGLKPKHILLTHGHIDHILGLDYISKKYDLTPLIHPDDVFLIQSGSSIANMYGLDFTPYTGTTVDINDNDIIHFGKSSLVTIHCPGHSPGGVCFYSSENDILIAGDVLFHTSIGRTDLPGGEYSQLINSIQTKLMTLPDNTTIYPGHSEFTTIGFERYNNPFL
jgi:hydroxyacylglutathione hydrolase